MWWLWIIIIVIITIIIVIIIVNWIHFNHNYQKVKQYYDKYRRKSKIFIGVLGDYTFFKILDKNGFKYCKNRCKNITFYVGGTTERDTHGSRIYDNSFKDNYKHMKYVHRIPEEYCHSFKDFKRECRQLIKDQDYDSVLFFDEARRFCLWRCLWYGFVCNLEEP